ncbi:ABC transporter permease [Mangrovitalea sediminis]|uniref:ABC transporter permease n=1 Tax=Mangrovitalea sediminis TaxID=1982043 RepID=UPI000BE59ACF|nr:ABC transporter permease [Mangrovitalea sediminis]
MSALNAKLRRELWHLRGQVLAIALVIGGGVAVCLMSLVNYFSMQATRADYYARNQFADVFVNLKRAPLQLVPRLRAVPGVLRLEPRIEAHANLVLQGFDEPISARFLSLPASGQPAVNRLYLQRGRLPDARRSNEVAVIGSFAEAHHLKLDDHFDAIINGRRQTLRIVGIVESPEFIYVIPPGAMLPDYQRYGIFWMPEKALAAAMDMDGAFNSLVLRTTSGASIKTLISRLDVLLEPYGGSGAYSRDDQFSHRFLSDELSQLKIMATLFPLIFMSVAMFLLNVVVGRLISTQRDIIAVLKAFGYSNRAIGWHYTKLVMVIAGAGLLLGTVTGLWLGRALGVMYRRFYRFPDLLFSLHPGWLLLIAVTVLVFAWLGAFGAIRRATRLAPAEAMRPEGPVRFHQTLLDRLGGGRWFSAPSKMILRQLDRRPGRTLFSVLGMALATGIIVVGNFQFDSVMFIVHTQFAKVQQQDLGVSFSEPIKASTLDDLVREPGIRYAEGRRTVPVELHHAQSHWRTAITGIPVGARLQSVIDERLQPVALPPGGLLLTDYLARKLHVGVGDRLSIRILDGTGKVVEARVAGVTREFLGVQAYMRLHALNRLLGDGPLINQALLNIDPAQAEVVYRSLRDRPKVLALNLRQAMLDSFFQTLAKTFLTFTFFNSLLGGVIAFGVIYNTVRISLAERGRELASLRVLGYTHREVAHILLGEVAVLMLLGIPCGWLVGWALASGLVVGLSTELYRIPLVLTVHTYALSASVVMGSALLSGWVVWRRLRRLDLVAVLKTRE